MTSRRMVPEPISCTAPRRRRRPEQVHALEDAFAPPAVRVLVVLVHHRDVVRHVLLLGEHAAHAVLHDHRHSYPKVGS